MDIALLLFVNCKFDIIIDKTLWTLCKLHDIALFSDM